MRKTCGEITSEYRPSENADTRRKKKCCSRIKFSQSFETHTHKHLFGECVDNYGDKCTPTKNEIAATKQLNVK